MLVCNSGKTYLDQKQKEALMVFLEDAPVADAEYKQRDCTIVCYGYDLPIGAITPLTQIIEQLNDQTYNYHTPSAKNNLGHARIWYTIDKGDGPKHSSALSPEWFKLIDGARVKLPKNAPVKMSPHVSAFFDRMKAEHKSRETEKSKETVTEIEDKPPEDKGKPHKQKKNK